MKGLASPIEGEASLFFFLQQGHGREERRICFFSLTCPFFELGLDVAPVTALLLNVFADCQTTKQSNDYERHHIRRFSKGRAAESLPPTNFLQAGNQSFPSPQPVR